MLRSGTQKAYQQVSVSHGSSDGGWKLSSSGPIKASSTAPMRFGSSIELACSANRAGIHSARVPAISSATDDQAVVGVGVDHQLAASGQGPHRLAGVHRQDLILPAVQQQQGSGSQRGRVLAAGRLGGQAHHPRGEAAEGNYPLAPPPHPRRSGP